ncbi:Isoform A [Aphelenchoides bicaudatus]|nr:Isoform A [Aphelenchoides bicaudatus]
MGLYLNSPMPQDTNIPSTSSRSSTVLKHISGVLKQLDNIACKIRTLSQMSITKNTCLHNYMIGRDPDRYCKISYIKAEVWPDCLDSGQETPESPGCLEDFIEGDKAQLIIGAKLGGRPETFNLFSLNKALDPTPWQQAEQSVYDHVSKGENRHALLQYTVDYGDKHARLRILRIYYHFQLYDQNGDPLEDKLEGIFKNPRPPIRVYSQSYVVFITFDSLFKQVVNMNEFNDKLNSIAEMQLKNIEKSKQMNQQTPIPRPSRDSHSCKAPFELLKPICLRDMKVPLIHKDRYLVCKVVGKPFSMVGTITIIQDLNGDVETVGIYNYSYDVNDTSWLSIGQILIIKEPYLRFNATDQGICLRVDSPTDLVLVDETDIDLLNKIGAEKFEKATCDVNEIRKRGNEYFIAKDYERATKMYSRAIRYQPNTAVLHLNKASAQLRSGYFEDAYKSAKTGLEKGGDREKALFRMGSAAYGMRDWKMAVDHFKSLLKEFPDNKNANTELKRATSRLAESKTGNYDVKNIYMESKNGVVEFDVADYMGPIEIVDVSGKGKGVVAKNDISKGTLIMVSKAFSTGYKKDFDGMLLTLNVIRKGQENAASKLQIIKAIEKVRKNPSTAKEVYSLYSGDFSRDEDIPNDAADVARIEQVSAYNRFGDYENGKNNKTGDPELTSCSLYLSASFFNHSCLANARRVKIGDLMFVYASKDLKKGDEVSLCYRSPFSEYSERKTTLVNTWRFECRCQLCKLDSKDVNCKKRFELFKQFKVFFDENLNQPKKVIEKGKPMLKQMRELYNGRDELKIDLFKMINLVAYSYAKSNDPQNAIKFYNELITLVDEEFELDFGLPTSLLYLALCYLAIDKEDKSRETSKKAFKMSHCVDLDHFRMIYPQANDIPDSIVSISKHFLRNNII